MLSLFLLLTLVNLNFGAEPQHTDWRAKLAQGMEMQEVVLPECPFATFQFGERHEDIKDCGMDNCGSMARFYSSRPDPNDPSTWVRHTIESCADYCRSRRNEGGTIPNPLGPGFTPLGLGCLVFSYAPIGGDDNHLEDTVCTLHRRADTTINEDHGPNQVMCSIEPLGQEETTAPPQPLNCPADFPQYALIDEDVMNCGMRNCGSNDRYRHATILDCALFCQEQGCAVFSFAPVGGDSNHLDTTVCTIHNEGDVAINEDHGPNQIMCRNPAVRPETEVVYDPAFLARRGSFATRMFAMAQKNSVTIAAIGLFSVVSGVGFMFLRRSQNQNEISYEQLTEDSNLL